jgi:hypothetical protein
MTKNGKAGLAAVLWACCAMACPSTAGAVQLHGRIAAKQGTQNARYWTFEVVGDGVAPVEDVRIESVRFEPLGAGEAACRPEIRGPAAFPLSLGRLAAGGALRATVLIDFGGCPNQAQFHVEVVLGGSGGARGTIRRNNDYR